MCYKSNAMLFTFLSRYHNGQKVYKYVNLLLIQEKLTKYWTSCISGSASEVSSSNCLFIWFLAAFTFLIFSSNCDFCLICSLRSLWKDSSWLDIVRFFEDRLSIVVFSCLAKRITHIIWTNSALAMCKAYYFCPFTSMLEHLSKLVSPLDNLKFINEKLWFIKRGRLTHDQPLPTSHF